VNFLNNLVFFAKDKVQGTEMEIPGIYITGHPPTPPEKVYIAAYISIGILVILAALLQYFLRKKWLSPSKTNGKDNKEIPPIRFRTLKTIAIIVIVVLFFFLSLEGILQIYVHFNPYQVFVPDPQSHWKINPAIQRKYQKTDPENRPESARRDGLIDWEFGRKKEPGAYRIICYGDSQTMGTPWVGHISKTYPKILQSELNDEFPEKTYEAINMGVSGYSSFQGLLFFKNIGTLYNPDCVIVGLGFHDAGASFAPDREITSDKPWVKKLRGILYRSQIYLMIRKKILERRAIERKEIKRPIFHRSSRKEYRENLKEFADIGKEKKILIVFLTVPQKNPEGAAHPEYVEVMKKASGDFNVTLVDAAAAMKRIPVKEQEKFFVKDGVHFNKEGNRFIAEQILKKIKPIICSKDQEPAEENKENRIK